MEWPQATPSPTVFAAIKIAHGLGDVLVEMMRGTLATLIDAALFATVRKGQTALQTTGTVQLGADGAQYDANPQGHFVVVTRSGESLNFEVTHLLGDFRGGAQEFLAHDHQFNIRYWDETGHDTRAIARYAGGSTNGKISGSVVMDGVPLRLQLHHEGTGPQIGAEEAEGTTTEVLEGTVEGPNFTLQIAERHHIAMVSASDSKPTNAGTNTLHLGHVLHMNGQRYTWSNVVLKSAFRDGQLDPRSSHWHAGGQILQDGTSFGSFRLKRTGGDTESGQIDILLDTQEETQVVDSCQRVEAA